MALALSLGAAACGLDRAGLGPLSPDGDASAIDGGAGTSSGGEGAPVGDDGGGTDASSGASEASAVCAVPQGWSAVVYEPSRNPCPAGYGASHDEYAGATAGAGACGCTCIVTTAPTCEKGTLGTQWTGTQFAGTGPCSNIGTPLLVNGPGCTGILSGQLQQGFSAEALSASGGACSSQLAADPTQVTKNGVRMCDVPASQLDTLCTGSPPAGFSACITMPGDVDCPSGAFTARSLIEDDEVLVCGACGACQVSASCQNAQVKFFSDGQCNNAVATFAASGSCVSTASGQNQGISAFEYTSQAQAACKPGSPAAPSFNPDQAHTVCCR